MLRSLLVDIEYLQRRRNECKQRSSALNDLLQEYESNMVDLRTVSTRAWENVEYETIARSLLKSKFLPCIVQTESIHMFFRSTRNYASTKSDEIVHFFKKLIIETVYVHNLM